MGQIAPGRAIVFCFYPVYRSRWWRVLDDTALPSCTYGSCRTLLISSLKMSLRSMLKIGLLKYNDFDIVNFRKYINFNYK